MRGLINTHKNEKKASYQASIVVILIACVGYNVNCTIINKTLF